MGAPVTADPDGTPNAVFNITGFDNAETCTVTESGQPAGYEPVFSGDCDTDGVIELSVGDSSYACTITNTRNDASLTVGKVYSPTSASSDAVTVTLTCESGSVNGGGLSDSELADPDGPAAEFDIAGFTTGDSCTVSEAVPDGFTADIAGDDCATDGSGVVDLVAGNTMNCTITNTRNDATVTVSKAYSPTGPTQSVGVTLTCDGDIGGDGGPVTADPDGTPNAVFNITGFDEPDTCTVTESGQPPGYTPVFSGDCNSSGVIALTVGDSSYACTITNMQSLTVLTAGGCTFDRRDRTGRQFPLILTPDGGATSKLNATNPGQFFMNAVYSGSATSLTLKVPFPFVTVGTNPVKIYNGVITQHERRQDVLHAGLAARSGHRPGHVELRDAVLHDPVSADHGDHTAGSRGQVRARPPRLRAQGRRGWLLQGLG